MQACYGLAMGFENERTRQGPSKPVTCGYRGPIADMSSSTV